MARLETDLKSVKQELESYTEVDEFPQQNEFYNDGPRDKPRELEEAHVETEARIADHVQRLDDDFHGESVDAEWSANSLVRLQTVMSRDELAGSSAYEMQCHSTLCRIEIEHDDKDGLGEFQLWFPHLVSETMSGITMNTAVLNDGRKSTVVYLARLGYELPDLGDYPN